MLLKDKGLWSGLWSNDHSEPASAGGVELDISDSSPNTGRIDYRRPSILLAIWFGAGLLPKAPGTWGSATAVALAWLIVSWGGAFWLLIAATAVFLIGIWAAAIYAESAGEADPRAVVIDEVAGQMLVLTVVPADGWLYLAGFVLFRAADIWKPWPVSWADRTLKGGFGIMFDDILAAVYAAAALFALAKLGGV